MANTLKGFKMKAWNIQNEAGELVGKFVSSTESGAKDLYAQSNGYESWGDMQEKLFPEFEFSEGIKAVKVSK